MEVVQYCGGCSVDWRLFNTSGDNISTVVGIASVLRGIASVLWRIASVLWRLFSTVGDNISTVGDNISPVEGIQYCGGIPSVLWGITAVHVGGELQYCGG